MGRSAPTLIAQSLWDGHRLLYVRRLAESLRAIGETPIVLLDPEAKASAEFARHLRPCRAGVTVVFGAADSVAAVAAVARAHGAGHVVLPDGDAYLPDLALHGWRGGSTLSVLIMRPGGQSPRPALRLCQSLVKRALRWTVRRRGIRVFALVSSLRRDLRSTELRDPIDLAGPVDTVPFGPDLDPGRYWFAVLGAVTLRKNLHLIAEALEHIDPARTGLLVAGVCDDDALAAAEDALARYRARGGAVLMEDRLLSDGEFRSATCDVDCVLVLHSNEGPSGVLVQAVLAGTRVIAGGAQSLRRDVAMCPESAGWVPLDVGRLAIAMNAAMRAERPRPLTLPAGGSLERLLVEGSRVSGAATPAP